MSSTSGCLALEQLCQSPSKIDEFNWQKPYVFCRKYQNIFNSGDKPLGKTDLVQFSIDLTDYSKLRIQYLPAY